MHILVAIVATLALLPCLATPSQASERTVARMGGLQATISQTTQWCGETVEVRVHATEAAQLSDDTRQLQLLAGGVRQILGFECPAIQQLQLIGSVDGQTAGTWTHTADGQLIAAQTATTPASTLQNTPIGREEIAEAQQILSELGYEPGPVDGLMGQNTKSAIEQFQRDQRLALDGMANPQLLEKLRSVVAARQSGPAMVESTPRPSFDCARAGTPTEFAICASPELAKLDRQMAEAYSTARTEASNPSAVVSAQRNWIARRNACGSNGACLAQSMQQRLQALGGTAVLSFGSVTGDATRTVLSQERIPAGVALEGGDAYSALLDRYIREHPDAARDPEFLPYFAGLGCMAEGWGRKRLLNPFEVAEIESAAQSRLDRQLAEASASPKAEPVLITFRANITAGDYDMAEGVFSIMAGRSITANIRPADFCQSVARAKDLRHRSVFPVEFRIATADGASLKPSHVVEMLGGNVAIDRERARAFYERGFPTIIVEVTGRVRSVSRAKAGVGFVTFEPVRATLRTQGNAPYSQELAVLGSEQLSLFVAGTDDGAGGADGMDALMRFDRDVYLIGLADMTPTSRAMVQYSTLNLDAPEAEALTGAITGAIGADPDFFERPSVGVDGLAANAVSRHTYILVAGDWRNRIIHAAETRFPNQDFNVIQIARAAGAAPTDETSVPPQVPLPAADFGPDEMPILRAWIPHYLDNASDAEQIETLERYIRRLQGNRDYAANVLFAEGAIEGRQAEFLARSAHDRWLAALEAQSVEPPFNMSVQIQTRNVEYDFESGDLLPFGGRDDDREALYRALRNAIISAGGLDQGNRLLGIKPPPYPAIHFDGGRIPARFAMDAGRAEEMITNRDIVFFDVALRITSLDYEEGYRGEHGIALEAEILGVNVATEGGEQLAALTQEDMPRIEREPVADEAAPVHETVHLARPRDILAAIANETGADVAELIESVYPSTSQDSFDRRDEISDLAASAQDIDLGGFWMSGYGRLADYDLDRGEYGLSYVQLTYPDSVSRNEKSIRRNDLLRLANVSARSGVRFAMPETEARSLRDAMRGADATFRARLAVQTPATDAGTASLPVTVDLVEIVVLHPGSDPQLLNDDEVVARINLEPSSDVDTADTGVAPSIDGSGGDATAADYDILGVRVGQPLAEGLALARSEFAPETILYGRRDSWIDADISRRLEATTPLAESVILVRGGAGDFLTIFHEPLVEDNPITGIARTITFAEGSRPKPEAIRDLLVEKYGEIGYETASVYLWYQTRQAPIPEAQGEMSVGEIIALSTTEQNQRTQAYVCRKELESNARVLSEAIQVSRRTGYPAFDTDYPLFDDSGERAPHPKARPLWSIVIDLHRADAKCDTDMVMAAIQQDDSGLVAALRVLVTSRAYVATIEEAAQAALLELNAAKQTTPIIDF